VPQFEFLKPIPIHRPVFGRKIRSRIAGLSGVADAHGQALPAALTICRCRCNCSRARRLFCCIMTGIAQREAGPCRHDAARITLLGGRATSMTAAKLRNLAARPAKPSLNPRPIPQ
jgi:hypothetical protein